jgi:serine/threonine protein kinase
MPLEHGSKLGPYEILSPITVSGAGEAYKASDTRSNHFVAIRFLPAGVAQNSGLKERLERDARTIASLNHPNICAMVELAHENGVDYVVTEYVEGETLQQRLARGPLDLEEALKVGIEIADALDKAHRQGVAHRGLNPSNVILAANGAKLLDFGLANLLEPPPAPTSASSLPTRSASLPVAAAPPGTAPYLAPEQLERMETGSSTDIHALGAILYEMVAGRPAFEGKTHALLIAAITTVDPEPLSKIQPMTPPELEYVITRCLAKAPNQRLQSAWDLVCELQWIAEGSGSQSGVTRSTPQLRKRDRRVRIALAAASLLALALMPAALLYLRGTPEPEEIRFLINNFGEVGTGAGPIGVTTPSLSPDGRWMSASRGSVPGFDLIPLGSGARQILLETNSITLHFWSADSRSIAFFEDGNLKRGDVSGGPAQTICEAPTPWGGGTWNRDGVIVFASGGILHRVTATGGQPTAISALDRSQGETEHASPFFLPDGRHFVYLAVSSDASKSAIYAGSLDSTERTRLFASESRAHYAAPGYLLFNRGAAVFAQPFDPDKLALKGEPIRIADGVPLASRRRYWKPDECDLRTRRSDRGLANGHLPLSYGRECAGPAAGGRGPAAGPQMSISWFDRSGRSTGSVGNAGNVCGSGSFTGREKIRSPHARKRGRR